VDKSVLALLFIIIIPAASAYSFWDFMGGQWRAEPVISGWYPLEPWEIEYCVKDGGTLSPITDESGQRNQFLATLTFTMSGEKTNYPDGTVLYEVAWYVHTLNEQEYMYNITIDADNGTSMPIVTNDVFSHSKAGRGYKAFLGQPGWTRLTFRFPLGEYTNFPIMEKET